MREQRVWFRNSRGDSLCGVLHYPDDRFSLGNVILCHGMESNKESDKLVSLSRALASKGVLSLRFDFGCSGESSGRYENITYTGEVDDLRSAYTFLQSRNPANTAVVGSSMGGTVALLFAAETSNLAAVVTIAAPLYPEKFPTRLLTGSQLDEWRQRGFIIYNGQRLNVTLLHDLEKIDIPATVKKITSPVFIIHGDADTVVPVEEAYELNECLPGPKRLSILKGADHRLSTPGAMEPALSEALEFLVDILRPSRHEAY